MGDRWFEDLIALMDDIHDPSPRPEENWIAPPSETPPLSEEEFEEMTALYLREPRD